MPDTVAALQARLQLIDRIRAVERELARDEQARVATKLLRGRSHDLGNTIQIVRLASIEIERRAGSELIELVRDLRLAAEQATSVLGDLLAASRRDDHPHAGAAIAPTVRAAAELARPAIGGSLELSMELPDAVRTRATVSELDAAVIAAVIDAAPANRIVLALRERVIQGKPWVELLRLDDRTAPDEPELVRSFEPFSLLHFVKTVVERAGGEVSLAPGRTGLELAIALPIAS